MAVPARVPACVDGSETGKATIVVATRNRWPDLRISLPRHTCPVLLVDNGSTDDSPRLAVLAARVFVGEEEQPDPIYALLAYSDRVVAHHHPSASRGRRSRQVRAARNRLLTAVLRRPWLVGRPVPREQRASPVGRQGVLRATPRVRRALAHRRPPPPAVERARALLDQPARTPSALRPPTA